MKKIFWHVNVKPAVITEMQGERVPGMSGGWLDSPIRYLMGLQDVQLCICYPVGGVEERGASGNVEWIGVNYDFISLNRGQVSASSYVSRYEEILRNFSPDVIHLHGTEYQFAFFCVSAAELCGMKERVVVSIQGVMHAMARDYVLAIPRRILQYTTLLEVIRGNWGYSILKNFRKRSTYELDVMRHAKHFIGRTSWDKACLFLQNRRAIYHQNNESLRSCFYDGSSWSIEKCTRHTLYVSQASYAVKGVHFLLESLQILKPLYPDLRVQIAGADMSRSNRIFGTSYALYIKYLIKKYNLSENVCFTGPLSAEQVKEKMLDCHVYVCPSAVENSPNSLGEAMLLGMPCVCSNVGGVADMATHEKEALLYPLNETYRLAYYIAQVFESDALANSLGTAARERALNTHDVDKNNQTLLDIYRKIMNDAK